MRRIHRFHMLSILGDLQNHPYDQVVLLGTLHFANPVNRKDIFPGEKLKKNMYYSELIESYLKELINQGLISVIEPAKLNWVRMLDSYQISLRDKELKLSDTGRELLGWEQMQRAGDSGWYGKSGYDGSVDAAKRINPGLFK